MTEMTFDHPTSEAQIDEEANGWYETWRGRIHEWVSAHADDALADLVLLVPDLLALVVRLAKDRRVPFLAKGQLLLAAAYVLNPFDLIPEGLAGVVGLADDAGVLALVLMSIKRMAGLEPEVLRDNWPGKGDVHDVIETTHRNVANNADRLFGDNVWEKIRSRFGASPLKLKGLRRGRNDEHRISTAKRKIEIQ